MESPESEKKTEQPDARTVDLRNIPEALMVLRAELARQQETQKGYRRENKSGMLGCRFADELARLNPARLKVAEESIEAAELWNEPPPARLHIDAKMTVVFLRFAADLLGVEVVKAQGKYQPQPGDKVRVVNPDSGRVCIEGPLTVAGSWTPVEDTPHWFFAEGCGSFPAEWLVQVQP
jgi:hypothetical protein